MMAPFSIEHNPIGSVNIASSGWVFILTAAGNGRKNDEENGHL
jgi:hypothetical protein